MQSMRTLPSAWVARRLPYYGWVMVVVGALARFASGPSQSFSFAVFIDPILAYTGLSRTALSTVYLIGTLCGAVVVMQVSRLVDRAGARTMLITMALILGGICLGLAFAPGTVAVLVLLATLRAMGQGPLPVIGTLLTVHWFTRRRGLAVALGGLGGTISNAALPPLAQALSAAFGWQGAYLVLGLMIWALVIPVALLLVRNYPEDLGLHPDGDAQPPEQERSQGDTGLPEQPRRVLTSLEFWLLAVPLSASSFIGTALTFHQVSIFAERGLGSGVAAAAFAPFAVAATASGLVVGVTLRKIGVRALLLISLGLLLGSLLLLRALTTPEVAVLYGLLLGTASGMQGTLSGVAWADHYGRRGLGRVQGAASMVSIVASAVAPLPLAMLQQAFAGYDQGLLVFAGVPLFCAVCAIFGTAQKSGEVRG
jgi:sugar phosphate permease